MTPAQLDAATGIGITVANEWAHPLTAALEAWGVRSLARFLAQITHESSRLTRLEENLNYPAQGLANTWPNRYAVDPKAPNKAPNALALKLQRDPSAIANNAYANRMGNGDELSGDGWRYRGRGLKMVTGKANYAAFEAASGCDAVNSPWLLSQRDYAAHSACWFWMAHNLDKLTDVRAITRVINGGELGLIERIALTDRALQVFA